jgi:RNA polymerase sigma factor (sigma-70 family)
MSFDSLQSWADAANRYPILTDTEVVILSQRIQKSEPGSKLHNKLVNKLALHNLRLALKWTRAYVLPRADVNWGDAKSIDLLQEAFFGLRKAAEKFDPKRGYAFSTYARAWVHRAVSRYHVDTMSTIRVPESSASEIFYYLKHGKARNEKVASWVPGCAESASKAYTMTSIDIPTEQNDGTSNLGETIAEDQSLTHRSGEQQTFNHDYCYSIMNRLGIDEQMQQLVMTYARIGNIDSALYKFKIRNKTEGRKAIRKHVAMIKEYVGAQ